MTRRNMLTASGYLLAPIGTAAHVSAQETPKRAFFELRCYYMRNSQSNQVQRTTKFISGAYLPAARRAGIGPIGIFSAVIAPESPFLIVLSGYQSLAGMQASMDKMAVDAVYQKAEAEFDSN
jgi:hypothetical protein